MPVAHQERVDVELETSQCSPKASATPHLSANTQPVSAESLVGLVGSGHSKGDRKQKRKQTYV